MDRLLETFDTPFVDAEGDTYDVQLYGRSRPGDTWEGWLVFARRRDGAQFVTSTETTQPSAEAVLYWATGLTDAYFDGAFRRAVRPLQRERAGIAKPPRLRDGSSEVTYLRRLNELERAILATFREARVTQLATRTVLDRLPHAHADVVRGIEDLEKRRRLLVRQTEGGTDWLLLTEGGVQVSGLASVTHVDTRVIPEPSKNIP